jgi:hypothetical protein
VIFLVTAVSCNRHSKRRIASPRSEVIDTTTNRLFNGLQTRAEVRSRYESFWNDLNPRSREVVRVLDVQCVIVVANEH